MINGEPHRADECCCMERGFLARVRPARGGGEFQAAKSYSVESLIASRRPLTLQSVVRVQQNASSRDPVG